MHYTASSKSGQISEFSLQGTGRPHKGPPFILELHLHWRFIYPGVLGNKALLPPHCWLNQGMDTCHTQLSGCGRGTDKNRMAQSTSADMDLRLVKTPFSGLCRHHSPDLRACLTDIPCFSPEVHPFTLQVLQSKTNCSTSLFSMGPCCWGRQLSKETSHLKQ